MKVAIFDLDGTLADSMPYWRVAARKYLADYYGIYAPESLADEVLKLTIVGAGELLKERYNLKKSAEEIAQDIDAVMERAYSAEVAPVPGAAELLKALAQNNVPMAIATATDRKLVDVVLEKFGWTEYFGNISTCTEAGVGKRDGADVFDMARRRLGAGVEESVVFEDSPFAARTARNAGYKVIGIGGQEMEQACSVCISSLLPTEEVLKLVL